MKNEIENISILLSSIEIEETITLLPIALIHHIFDTYLGCDFKLLIHKEGSSDEDRCKVLSIELVMRSRMEDYFKDNLLSDKFKRILCNEACRRGYVSTLKWARENGCSWSSDTCIYAAENGHLNCLHWARENGCPWDTSTCSYAARSGHLSCLQWAHENGCPWDSDTCYSAAVSGFLHCLQWARESGCPWYSDTCLFAAVNGHLSCLQWAVENGCPWDREECLDEAKNDKIRLWIESIPL